MACWVYWKNQRKMDPTWSLILSYLKSLVLGTLSHNFTETDVWFWTHISRVCFMGFVFTKLLSLFRDHTVNCTISTLLSLFWKKNKWRLMSNLAVCLSLRPLSNLPSNGRLFWLHFSGFQASRLISFKSRWTRCSLCGSCSVKYPKCCGRKLGCFLWLQTFDTEPSLISWYDLLMMFPPDHVRLQLVLSSVILLLSWDSILKCL
jgi:hypothetical protein